jgi:hypothetical protein
MVLPRTFFRDKLKMTWGGREGDGRITCSDYLVVGRVAFRRKVARVDIFPPFEGVGGMGETREGEKEQGLA